MMLTLSDMQVISALLGLLSVIVVGIAAFRYRTHRSSRDPLNNNTEQLLSERTKYKSLDFLRHRAQRMGLGLSASLLIAVIAMSWTTYELADIIDYGGTIDIEDLEVVPNTYHQKPKPIQPPPPQVIEEIEEDIIDEDQPDLLETDVEVDDIVEEVPFVEEPVIAKAAPVLPLPEAPEDDIDELVRDFVHQKPWFGGCKEDRCSDQELLKFLGKHIKYPSIALENGIKGRVTAQFIVERDGSISDITILRGIGAGCDEEVIRVLEYMNKDILWQPGMQNGKPVRVRYRLPVTFTPVN